MVVPAKSIRRQELFTEDGQVYAYFVPAEEMSRLQTEMEALRSQVATLQRQKDHYVDELWRILKTWMPIPPSEEEILAARPNSEELEKLIADLESR